jgi:formamidopyrimidine-DNA glycosylase
VADANHLFRNQTSDIYKMLEKVYGKNTQVFILVHLGMEGKMLTDDEVPADNFRH